MMECGTASGNDSYGYQDRAAEAKAAKINAICGLI